MFKFGYVANLLHDNFMINVKILYTFIHKTDLPYYSLFGLFTYNYHIKE